MGEEIEISPSSAAVDVTSQHTIGIPENREDYLNLVVPLYQASLSGDWETAKIIFDKRPDLVRFYLSENRGTTLHVVATLDETKQTLNFVKNLVRMMTEEDLKLKNKLGNTAFHVACIFGNTEMATIMMEKNESLMYIRGSDELLPLSASALAGKYSSVKYLYNHLQKVTGNHWQDKDKKFTLLHCVESGFFDIAFQILEDLSKTDLEFGPLLERLARKPERFNRVEKNLATRIIKSTFSFFRIKVQQAAEEDTSALKLLETIWGYATKTMNVDDIKDMLRGSPDSSFSNVPKYKHKVLFVAAEAGNTRFIVEEVYDMLPPYLREQRNHHKKTPYEIFSCENKTQLSEGLQWMKDCMVVATLIITVAFAVAFTVPGGCNQDNGLPLFIHQPDFLVFVIADAISLFSSSTSLLVFLSILTSGYEQLDFLFALPRKLLAGLLSLFISVAAMMVTFSASFFVMYHNGLKWVPILIAAFATIPVVVFAILQFHILVDMIRSMYDSRYLFNPRKRLLYPPKQKLRSNNSSYWQFSYKSIIKSIFSKRS